MFSRISEILGTVFSSTHLWLILTLITLLDTSSYELLLFTGNSIIAIFLFFIFILLTNKIALSVYLVFLLAKLFLFASILKADLLCSVLRLEDLDFLFNFQKNGAVDLVKSYFSFEFLLLVIFAAWLTYFVSKKSAYYIKCKNNNKIQYAIQRSCMVIIAVLMIYTAPIYLANPESYANNWLDRTKVTNLEKCERDHDHHDLKKTFCQSMGVFLDIVQGIAEPHLSKLYQNHSSELAVEASKEYNNYFKPPSKLPNIILVLNESIFDPTTLNYEFAKAIKFDFFHDRQYLISSGKLKVHIFGGGSAVSEYGSTTGISNKVFNGPNSYPFLNMTDKTKSSLFRELKKAGYYTIVVYPHSKDFLNAKNAYKELGADKVIDIKDYGHNPKLWNQVSEKTLGEIFIEEIKKAPRNKPVFIASATIKNHGPHDGTFPHKIDCEKKLDYASCSKLNDYVDRLSEIDNDWADFNSKVLNDSDPIMLINYGDHQPSFEGKMNEIQRSYEDRNGMDLFRTFFTIRANFDIPEMHYENLDITYLPSLILDMIDSNNSQYYRAASVIREKCNGELFDCNDQYRGLVDSYLNLMADQLKLD